MVNCDLIHLPENVENGAESTSIGKQSIEITLNELHRNEITVP